MAAAATVETTVAKEAAVGSLPCEQGSRKSMEGLGAQGVEMWLQWTSTTSSRSGSKGSARESDEDSTWYALQARKAAGGSCKQQQQGRGRVPARAKDGDGAMHALQARRESTAATGECEKHQQEERVPRERKKNGA